MSFPLKDKFGRQMDYLRLAVTDRCNLRCQYCMPFEGIPFMQRTHLLTWQELERLSRIFVELGVTKIRITGGEPFVRSGLTGFLDNIQNFSTPPELGITTNATLLRQHLFTLKKVGVTSLNISLDSLQPEIFHQITRRSNFKKTINSIGEAYNLGFHLKINMVMLPGVNEDEIPEFIQLTENRDITVRFIEPMPFNGDEIHALNPITGDEILERIRSEFPLESLEKSSSQIAARFRVTGYAGKIGIIYGWSRSFCDTCSRIRVSASGQMRTCLYGKNVLDLRAMLRNHDTDQTIKLAIRKALQHRYKDGFEAAAAQEEEQYESMAAIGG